MSLQGIDGAPVACGLGIGKGLDVVFRVCFSIAILQLCPWCLASNFEVKQRCTHNFLCHFTHLKLAFHKLISGKLCVFLMYMYS